jgi:Undecaprenyl-phosphate glucose phosphotransferase
LSARYSKYIPAIAITGDFIILNTLFVFAFHAYAARAVFYTDKNILFYLYLNVFWLILSIIFKAGDASAAAPKKKLIFIYIKIIVFFFFFFLLFFQLTPLSYFPRAFIEYLFPLFFVLLLIWKFVLYYTFVFYRKMGYNYRKIIIVGKTKNTLELRNYFTSNALNGYKFLGFVDEQKDLEKEIIGSWDDLDALVSNLELDEIYIALDSVPPNILQEIIELVNQHPVKVRIVPDLGAFSHKSAELVNYDMVPVLQIHQGPLSQWYNRMIKRIFDIVLSLSFILGVLWWFTIILQILTWLTGHRAVFFIQKRTGTDGKVFNCIKYRTMIPNHDADIKQATAHDDRITPIGKLLRKSSLDELPQFINVLLGQMSLVGPRPHMLVHTHEYRQLVKRFMLRHTVKPGITGLAQVRGYRGEVKNPADIETRFSFDVNYIENWNFGMDLKIIFLTLKLIMLGDKNAY